MQRLRTVAAEEDADHSNMIIVLNASREELEAAPTFAYLDDRHMSLADPDGSAKPANETGSSQQKSN
ncbi:MAG: hypothetical protein Q8P46_08415 [Hyphomicrobiales bacterium]|nr:hypothetical protein [Hyphomicrobiales bacterium]